MVKQSFASVEKMQTSKYVPGNAVNVIISCLQDNDNSGMIKEVGYAATVTVHCRNCCCYNFNDMLSEINATTDTSCSSHLSGYSE